MQSTAGDQTAAHAVDGFVSKIRHTRAPSNAPIAQKGPHFQQHRNQQVAPESPCTAFTQSVIPPSPSGPAPSPAGWGWAGFHPQAATPKLQVFAVLWELLNLWWCMRPQCMPSILISLPSSLRFTRTEVGPSVLPSGHGSKSALRPRLCLSVLPSNSGCAINSALRVSLCHFFCPHSKILPQRYADAGRCECYGSS